MFICVRSNRMHPNDLVAMLSLNANADAKKDARSTERKTILEIILKQEICFIHLDGFANLQ
jgi:hypothetical protein